MACWNRVTAHIVEGLPKKQVEGLCYARKVPLIYARAGLNNWQAFADAKINSISPRGNSLFWDTTSAAGRRALRLRLRAEPDGSFRLRLKAPDDGEAAVYRMNTRVKLYDWFAKTYPTFTLPRYVDLG